MSVRRLLAASLLVGLAVASPNADELPTRIFHIGIVAGTPRSSPERVAFEDRLRELGYVEGRNLAIDFVHYDDLDRLAAAVGEMARRRVDVLLIGGHDALLKAAVTTARSVPVVITGADTDPLARGYIASLSHPGGNLTGVVWQQLELMAKRVDLLLVVLSTQLSSPINSAAFPTPRGCPPRGRACPSGCGEYAGSASPPRICGGSNGARCRKRSRGRSPV
jgi:putative ABC transport system substrate-binding protein